VTTFAPPRRRLLTAKEWAARWHTSEARALMFLEGFRRAGLAECRCGYWRATAKAQALHLVDRDGVPL
jgi:hypothetical protein